MASQEDDSAASSELAELLRVLASDPRLELLRSLRKPRALNEIRISPSASRLAGTERPASRQAVSRHLDQLMDAGLVRRTRTAGPGGDVYELNHERLFALVDDIRQLSRLQPYDRREVADATIVQAEDPALRLPLEPRLLVAYGREEGVGFPLHGGQGTKWTLGRAAICEIRLDYDPFISASHATIERHENGFEIVDLRSRNGTLLDWHRLASGGRGRLRPGSILVVGRSVLVFQASG